MAATELFGPHARIGIVGLGAGTLACYARPGKLDILRNRSRRRRHRPRPRSLHVPVTVPAQGADRPRRCPLTLVNEPPACADLLVVDAFSSDSVPMHLLTREAFGDYRRPVGDRGLLLVHISNRYLDLKPVIASAAAEEGWTARLRIYRPDAAAEAQNETESDWIAMSPSPETMERLVKGSGERWTPVPRRAGFASWTDDHASVLPLISLRDAIDAEEVYWAASRSPELIPRCRAIPTAVAEPPATSRRSRGSRRPASGWGPPQPPRG